MKETKIVIGAMFGDEGKGNVTDVLCAENKQTLNVRFNGGAQASHTVVTPDGKRNAFRHFGSGSFTGARTYLSEKFIVNVFSFGLERERLINEFGISPKVYVNPNCFITTLWDMYINQAVETMRADKRHGSCGMGINETVHRSKYDEYRLTVHDLLCEEELKKKLEAIQNEYVPMRLKNKYAVSLEQLPIEYQELLSKEHNIDMTIFYVKEFLENVILMDDSILEDFQNIVFEGAQGLMLDQQCSRFWPNVTTSNTGIKNAISILEKVGLEASLDIYYVSRCYATRHGRGEFPTATENKPYSGIVDLTNVPNEFQESLRFGFLDVDLLIEGINNDLNNLTLPAEIYLTFTCFDQLDDVVKYKVDEKIEEVSKNQFLSTMLNIFKKSISNFGGIYITKGEKRDNLIKIEENPSL